MEAPQKSTVHRPSHRFCQCSSCTWILLHSIKGLARKPTSRRVQLGGGGAMRVESFFPTCQPAHHFLPFS